MIEKYIEILEELISEIVEEKITLEIKTYGNENVIKGYNNDKTCRIEILNEKTMKMCYKGCYKWFYEFDPEDEDDYIMIDIILNLLNI